MSADSFHIRGSFRVLGNFIWTAIDYIGESSIGANGHNEGLLACGQYCAQPFPYHISFCGDLDVVGGQKPQAFLRRVLWNNSRLEMAVHAPVAKGSAEVVGQWVKKTHSMFGVISSFHTVALLERPH